MNFKFDGILLHSNSNSWVVENMQILSNGRRGINAEFSVYSRYLYNSILVNGDDGIACGEYCHVEGSNVSDNGSMGIRIRSGTVLGNTISSNRFQGIYDNFGIADTGFGNNTLISNSTTEGGDQVIDGLALHPNVCMPTPC